MLVLSARALHEPARPRAAAVGRRELEVQRPSSGGPRDGAHRPDRPSQPDRGPSRRGPSRSQHGNPNCSLLATGPFNSGMDPVRISTETPGRLKFPPFLCVFDRYF